MYSASFLSAFTITNNMQIINEYLHTNHGFLCNKYIVTMVIVTGLATLGLFKRKFTCEIWKNKIRNFLT